MYTKDSVKRKQSCKWLSQGSILQFAVLSVRPGSLGTPAGTHLQKAGCIPVYPTRGKGALGPLLSAPVGASKRETPTSNLTESTEIAYLSHST